MHTESRTRWFSNERMNLTKRPITVAALVAFALAFLPVAARAQCGCMDVALVIDDTDSMGFAIDNVKNGLTNIIAVAQLASGNDIRLGLVSFADDIDVDQPFTNDVAAVTAAVNALTAGGGGGFPDASDEALSLVVSGSASAGCTVNAPRGPLGSFRSGCVKVAILVTDANPGGCHDSYTDGVDDVHAGLVATNAAAGGVRVSAVFVEGFDATSPAHPVSVQGDVMLTYATVTGGVFTNVPADGVGTGDIIQQIIATCGGQLPEPPSEEFPVTSPAQHPFCITRDARFWFTHLFDESPLCATLLKAIEAMPDSRVALGFMGLPQEFRNADAVKDEVDAAIEALGFFWRSTGRTGEDGGLQTARIASSRLCRERKRLSAELIATLANNALLGTVPAACTYTNEGVATSFPTDLIEQAGEANASEDVIAVRAMTLLLRKFNRSGLLPDFQDGLQECSPYLISTLRDFSRDATTQVGCPGVNDFCQTAEGIVHFPFSTTINLRPYSDDLSSPVCAVGGRDAFWKISPPVAAAGRSFVVETAGSNFDTVVSVRQGTCGSATTIVCSDNVDFTPQSRAVFTVNGTDTYFIVVEGKNGASGRLKVRVTSF